MCSRYSNRLAYLKLFGAIIPSYLGLLWYVGSVNAAQASPLSVTDSIDSATGTVTDQTIAEQELEPGRTIPKSMGDLILRPTPEERSLSSLHYLDSTPNPLTLPTQPEEVEILETFPITLEDAIELAYRNNPGLQVVSLELEQSEVALQEARAGRFPSSTMGGFLEGQGIRLRN